MFIEIEEKFELTDRDYEIIKSKLNFKSKKDIEDVYMDNSEYYLFLNHVFFRKRNSVFELKYRKSNLLSEEYNGDNAIKKLHSFNCKLDNLKELFLVNTSREKYVGEINGEKYIIDVDFHGLGKRYEIEVTSENEEKGMIFINKITKYLDLDAVKSISGETKGMLHIKKFVPELYNKMLKVDFYKANIN